MAAYDIEKDIGPRVQIILEILAGEMEVAKGMLRTLIKVTSVILRFLTRFGRNAKSTMRMLSPDVDPGIKAFIAVVRAAEHQSEKAADQGKTH